MFSFISTAHAQAAPAATSGGLGGLFGGGAEGIMTFLPMILMFVVIWFIMIRPQMKKQKETKAMIEAIKSGDEVITAGGILGKITKLTEQYIVIEVATGSEITMQRNAVAQVLPKGTLKSI
jgi:preprotein translocase subunit YajC